MEIINLLNQAQDADSILQKEFANDVKRGLSGHVKTISSKYLYDDIGSRLFKRITELDEYYLTRTEMAIIRSIKDRLPMIVDSYEVDIIELGVGDGQKSSQIIKAFLDYGCDTTFFPIDISSAAFDLLNDNIAMLDHCSIKAIVADYQRGLHYCKRVSTRKKLVLFLGSNIGNFTSSQAVEFITHIRQDLSPGDFLLIGFDLKKEIDRLIKAYDDSQGVTRDFNLNLLNRINRELGGEFDLTAFQHLAVYNPRLSAMESHLLSLKQQHVPIKALDMEVAFDYYEPIHLEFSFKFNMIDIQNLASATGFKLVRNFVDDNGYFSDSLWQATEESV
ncbi:L-histidine N(alpha)-methyltransferase [Legionella sp. W05-934-2]|jgi:dimethylhistidine N-methyltransferase|uniref:L-histidine N(alpha)-methyltransferase n=1 Tax=Legionella sp. W05-934-2 TaxID=1198649 RepID=UPI003462131D